VLHMVTTTVKAEDMSMGPFGGLTLEDEIEDESLTDVDQFESLQHYIDYKLAKSAEFNIFWEVTYSLSTKGEVIIFADTQL
jgi:hypothetical protein